jgi:hypothetical protein
MKANAKFLVTLALASALLAMCALVASGRNNIAWTKPQPWPPQSASQPPAGPNPGQHKAASPIDENRVHDAICSVVYQVDRSPSPRGYRYLFYGNGFFINKDGYLLTVAHVLSQLHGGQPNVLLRSPNAAPHFVPANVIVLDRDHDVAVLQVTPNPFASGDAVAFLPLDASGEAPGRTVVAAALRPFTPRDAWTLDPALEERPSGEVLRFETSKLAKGAGGTELFLFNHAIELGQSGAPVIALDTGGVAGLVEGKWLRDDVGVFAAPAQQDEKSGIMASTPTQLAPIPGAAIPIHYAISMLEQKGIAWHEAVRP